MLGSTHNLARSVQPFGRLLDINLPLGHMMSHTKFWPDRFSRFYVYWIQTNKQTDKQSIYID